MKLFKLRLYYEIYYMRFVFCKMIIFKLNFLYWKLWILVLKFMLGIDCFGYVMFFILNYCGGNVVVLCMIK